MIQVPAWSACFIGLRRGPRRGSEGGGLGRAGEGGVGLGIGDGEVEVDHVLLTLSDSQRGNDSWPFLTLFPEN